MTSIPILLMSDNPAILTGLARITRHLAVLLSGMPEYRVGTFGRGGVTNRKLPWAQYYYPESAGWGQNYLPLVWNNFSEGERGVVFTIMDAARMHWFSRADLIVEPKNDVTKLCESDAFEKWGYFPIDHVASNGSMSQLPAETVKGYDKVLAYTIFGAEVLQRVLGREVEWCPHGINLDVFKPRGRQGMKFGSNLDPNLPVIGMVATNQVRKDWGQACAIVRELKDRGHKIVFWLCVDELKRYWNIPALLKDYKIEDQALVMDGSKLSDESMSYFYSMCDVTILPTLGEGFGYPIVESMACGTPCITTNYAGGKELITRQEWLITPIAYREEAPISAMRPVTKTEDWVDAVENVLSHGECVQECVDSVRHLDWNNLGEVWKKLFRKWAEEFWAKPVGQAIPFVKGEEK